MIAAVYEALGGWSWMILGAVLLGLEIAAPGTIFLWFALAAFVTGLIAFVIDMSWQGEVISFLVLSVVLLVIGRLWFQRVLQAQETDENRLHDRGGHLIGRTFNLDEPIRSGQGRLKVDDSYWRITGPDLKKGTRVEVLEAVGTVLKVGPCE